MHAWHKTIIGPKPSNLSIQAQLFSEMMCKQLYCLGIETDELFSFSDLNWSSVLLRRNTPTNFPSAKVNMTEKRADTVLSPPKPHPSLASSFPNTKPHAQDFAGFHHLYLLFPKLICV